MNYKVIIYLLITFINSKKEYNYLEETVSCSSGENKDQCLGITIPKQNFQCCYEIEKDQKGEQEQSCMENPKDLEGYQNFLNSNEYKEYLKENYGTYMYNHNKKLTKTEVNIYCNNGQATYYFCEDNYTEDEISRLKNKNHCLNKYESKLYDYTYDIGNCKDSLLLDSSKNAGFECGNFNFYIKINSEKTLTFKTCNLFNLNLYSALSKFKPDFITYNIDTIALNQGYHSYESFTAKFNDEKGNTIKYDSITGKFNINGHEIDPEPDPTPEPVPDPTPEPDNQSSNVYILDITNYLILLILIIV